MALFGFGRKRPEDEARRRVEAWAREGWNRPQSTGEPESVVRANEIVCADPACPGVETVILILGAGRKSLAVKLAKPMSAITREDVLLALSDVEHPTPDS